MDSKVKAYAKITFGCAKGVNALATASGYGALSFLTGNHNTSLLGLRIAKYGLESAKKSIVEGMAELAEAKGGK